MPHSGEPEKQMLSDRVHDRLRVAIMRGDFGPDDPLKPAELATHHQVSLAVVREALVRLAGEGLAQRLPNRGFAVPAYTEQRWQDILEARRTVEPVVLRLSIARGDLEWETLVRAAHHRLTRTLMFEPQGGTYYSDSWSEAHRLFHRALMQGCANTFLLETFDRMWAASELTRRWSVHRTKTSERAVALEHKRLERGALARDADVGAHLLSEHLSLTANALATEPLS